MGADQAETFKPHHKKVEYKKTAGSSSSGQSANLNFLLRVAKSKEAQIAAAAIAVGSAITALHGNQDSVKAEVPQADVPVSRNIDSVDTEDSADIVDMRESDSRYDLFYPNLTSEQRAKLHGEILYLKEVIRNHYLAGGGWEKVREYEEIVSQWEQNTKLPENLLVALSIAESSGDRFAESEAGAKGPFQIMDDVAEIYSEKYGVNFTNEQDDFRFDADAASMVTASEFKESLDLRWGEDQLGFAIWEWHAGAPQIYEALRIYIQHRTGQDLGDIMNENLTDKEAEALQVKYKNKIAQLKINAFNLIQNETVRRKFSSEEFDSTLEYVERVLAALITWDDAKKAG